MLDQISQPPSTRSPRRLFPGILLVCCSCLLFTGCGGSVAGDTGAKPAGAPPKSLVYVATVEARQLSPEVKVVGTVIPKRKSIVASGADGVVQKYNVHAGNYVEAGTLLSELRMVTTNLGIAEAKALLKQKEQEYLELKNGSRPEEVAEALSKMKAAEAVHKFASKDLKRSEQLFRENAIQDVELDNATEHAQAAEQNYEAAKATYDLINSGAREEVIEQKKAEFDAWEQKVGYLEAEKEKRYTRAPYGGYIVTEHTDVGQWLSKGDPVVTLSELDEVEVLVNLDQWDVPKVQIGKEVKVKIQGVSTPDWSQTQLAEFMAAWEINQFSPRSNILTGQILAVVPRSNWGEGSRTFPVRVNLKNWFETEGENRVPVLKEGMMAEVVFQGKPAEAVMVPKDSLVRTTRGTLLNLFLPKENGEGVVKQLQVQTGLSDGEWIEVISDEVQPGMQVITDGAERVRPSQPVKIAEAKAEKN